MQLAAATDIGKIRKSNEDNYFIYNNDWVLCGFVADGMGGHEAGETASKMAVDIISNVAKNSLDDEMDYVEAGEKIRKAFVETNYKIYEYSIKNGFECGIGTTSTFAMIYKNKLVTVHVGDSRVYTVCNDIKQITKDHTYVNELVMRGEISKEEAKTHPKRNYITRAMGIEETVKIDVSIIDYTGETVLICSDGLTSMVSDSRIAEIISNDNTIQHMADELIDEANKNGGKDNITVVLLKK